MTTEHEKLVLKLLNDDTKIDELLFTIDDLARDTCGYEYGLPLHDGGHREILRKAVLKWLASLEIAKI